MPRHVLCIGAHPDDCEGSIGGTAALLRARGDVVRFVSVTDGSKGHFAEEYMADPDALVRRRHEEAQAAAAVIGAEYECMGIPDGEVFVTLAATEGMVRVLRSFGEPGQGPDLVLLNRPNDYHRDHRYTARLVLDASYMLTVPLMCPDTPALRRMPVFAYWHDAFTEGGAFRADVAVSIDAVIEQKVRMICAHRSQFFEWIPYNAGTHSALAGFPSDPAEQWERVAGWWRDDAAAVARAYAARLPAGAQYAEAFQVSEYGHRPDAGELASLIP
ncbi:MAG: PIG-L family deacetylase [Chthonomonadales bacterium]|nr:PIG-L family deacetylase [Chthonomonadales bacterium]